MKHLQKNTPGQLASYLGIAVIALLFSISLWQLAAAGWIQAKAIVAQHLLEDAWDSTGRQNETGVKPWPWADTWPMARLLVPAQGIDQIVLAGDSGSSLAFGPAFSLASARPGETGLTVISGHRDTHFRFIEKLKRNQTLTLQTKNKTTTYRINRFDIVDSRSFTIAPETEDTGLLLVTCYPFNATDPGGPLRYLVYAAQTDSRQLPPRKS